MKLIFGIIAVCLVIAAVALPSRNLRGDFDPTEKKEAETARTCTRQIGQNCTDNCDCCGSAVICGYITVGSNIEYLCMNKTSNNWFLNQVGYVWNAMKNAASMCVNK
uniref:GTx5-1 n=1 Tax=Grammostola rosea TaxID=432528 RepID=M5AWW2_GRARO|nr:GTx5-1 [Grammostola rosea]